MYKEKSLTEAAAGRKKKSAKRQRLVGSALDVIDRPTVFIRDCMYVSVFTCLVSHSLVVCLFSVRSDFAPFFFFLVPHFSSQTSGKDQSHNSNPDSGHNNNKMLVLESQANNV